MAATLRITRVTQLPNPLARNVLYLVDTPNPTVFDIYLSSEDGLSVERSFQAQDVLALLATLKNIPNGIVGLDGDGLIPSSLLPSYVDDVLEYPATSNFPVTGVTGKIYVTTLDNKVYRWSGSAYFELSSLSGVADAALKLATARTINGVAFDGSSNIVINAVDITPRVGEWEKAVANGVATLDANAKLVSTQLPTISKATVGLGNVDNTSDVNKPVSTAQQQAITDNGNAVYASALQADTQIYNLATAAANTAANNAQANAIAASAPIAHVGSSGTSHAAVTTSVNGFMLATDKVKLDAISGTNTGDQTTITGNAGSASKLQTARTINGVSFDGTANITLPVVTPALPALNIAFGAADNTLTSSSKLTWNEGLTQLALGGGVASPTIMIPSSTTRSSLNITGQIAPIGTTQTGGNVGISAGSTTPTNTNQNGGMLTLKGGDVQASGTGSGNGGMLTLSGGTVFFGTGVGGNVSLSAGSSNSDNGTGGNVIINAGGNKSSVGTATGGAIRFYTNILSTSPDGTTGLYTNTNYTRQFVIRSSGAWMLGPTGIESDTTSAGTIGQVLTSNGPTQAPQWADNKAIKLLTARFINGVAFDGSADITINAVDATSRIASSEKGAVNGVATLDATGKVPTTQLPSFVDDVLEAANLAAFPATGETGKIYVALDTNKTYRWSGSAYVYITSGAVDSVAGKTGVVTLVKADVGLDNVDNTADTAKPVSTAQQTAINAAQANAIAASAPSVHVGSSGTSHAAVSTTVNGFMLATDKVKLDAITGTNTGDETAAGIRTKLGITTLSGSNTGDQTTITGNAGSASKLQTARTINGVSFDGTANITLPVPTVTAKQIPFGSATNLLTANSKLTWDNSFNILTITPTASSPAFINSGATTGQTHDMVVQGHDSTDANGASMPGSLQLFAGFNRTTGSTEFGGSTTLGAGDSNITNGTASGGDVYINGGNSNNPTGTGNGGTTNIYGGSALASTGLGGDVLLQGGDSNAANAAGGNVNITTGGNTATDALSTGGVINFNTQSGTSGNPKTTVSRQFMIRNNGSWVLGPNGTATDLTSAGTVGQTLTSTGPNQAPQWADTVAVKLVTARTINGVAFDGTGNITINAVDSTARIASSEKGAVNGVATLDATGKVPSTQLPSFVDDVVEAANFAALPATGETGKIYVTLDTNKTYRWGGSSYTYITSGAVDSVAGKTGVITLVKGDVGLGNVDNTSDVNKPVSTAQQTAITAAQANAIAASAPVAHVGSSGTSHAAVTTTVNGFMLATDKVKLDAISGTNTGDQTTITGNAGSASKLQTARTINGVSFDGTANITVTAVDQAGRDMVTAMLGAVNGIATLDGTGKVPAAQLPSFVDDIIEAASLANFPVTGETGKIYVALDNNRTYRWSGSAYVAISSGGVDSVAGKTGVVSLVKADVGLGNVDNTSDASKPVSTAQQSAIDTAKSDAIAASAPSTHVGSGGTSHAAVSTTVNGFMLATDKVKLDAISGTNTGDETAAGIRTKLGITTLSGSNTGDQTTITGNAGSASKFQTARTINGVSFDGTANITINAVDATARVASSLLGVANGVATLDATGKVPSAQLPSFVDDVIEATNLAAFPATGETGKIYVALDTNKTYRWSGSVYVYITSGAVDSVAGKTGVVTLVKADVGLGNVDNTADTAKPVSTAQQTAIDTAQANAIAASAPVAHVGSGGTSHAAVSTTVNGFMLATDKVKLDAISGTNTGDETAAGIRTKLGITTLSGSNTGDQTTITGNAGSATVLQTARLINGVSFNGSSDITVSAVDTVTPRVAVSSVGAVNGVAPLGSNGRLPFANIFFTKDVAFIPALTGTTLIPYDNTTPLNTEGTELCNITLGPSSATSQLFINGCISVDCNTATRTMVVACFRGSVCIGAQSINFITLAKSQMFPFAFYDVNYGSTLNGTTGVYSIRFGVNTAATWYVNRNATVVLNGMQSLNNPVYFEELN